MTVPASIPLSLNGYTDLPDGKVAAIATFLEMNRPPPPYQGSDLEGFALEQFTDLTRYRRLFAHIGEPWLWHGRAVMNDTKVAGILLNPNVEAYALVREGVDVGLLELDFRVEGEVELAYFGLVPGTTGKGIGSALMNEAIRRAFVRPVKRFFVHTCSLDHPSAVSFYVKSGFRPYKQAVEITDDPRLQGFLPLTAAPQVPIFPPKSAET